MKLPNEFETEDEDDALLDILYVIMDIIYALIVTLIIIVGAYILISDLQHYGNNNSTSSVVIDVEQQ